MSRREERCGRGCSHHKDDAPKKRCDDRKKDCKCHGCEKNCKCDCCNIFGLTLGELLLQSSKDIAAITAAALPLLPPDERAPRVAAVQSFYSQAATIAENAFSQVCVSKKCCEGYAAAVNKGTQGIILVAVSNAYNPGIPIGLPTDTLPGTVYGNLFIALEQLRLLVAAAKEISRLCSRKQCGSHDGKKCQDECDSKCQCCNALGEALGELIFRSAKDIVALTAAAIALFGAAFVAARLTPVQFFYLGALAQVRDAFTQARISPKCCLGFAEAISLGVQGIAFLTVSNAYNPAIPIGLPTDTLPGTVWGNVKIALEEVAKLIVTAKKIAQC